MAVTFDDIFLNIPQAWKRDPELMRFATILSRLGLRTGGGATDTVAETAAEVSTNATLIAELQDDVDAFTDDLEILTEDHETSIQVEDLYARIEILERELKQLKEDIETNGD